MSDFEMTDDFAAKVVRKWLDGGCSSWGVPDEAIRKLLWDRDKQRDKIKRQATVIDHQAERIRGQRAELKRLRGTQDRYTARLPFTYVAIMRQNNINYRKFREAEAKLEELRNAIF
jgi:hypothetical protein